MPAHVVRRSRAASYLIALAAVLGLLLAGCTTGRPAHVAGHTRATVSGSTPAQARARTSHHHRSHPRAKKPRHRRHAAPTTQPAADVPRVDLPDRSLTPGVVLTTRTRRVCTPGYASSVRDVPSSESDAVYARYDVVHVPYTHEVDHLVSLELGGSNAIGNLWPEPYTGRWGARTKDVLENRLHDLVCSGGLSLRRAQHLEARNWVAAYRRFVGGTPTVEHQAAPSAPATAPSAPTSSNGSCEPGYSPCLPVTSDLDCGDIPDSEKPIHVTGSDPYRLDGDGDGYACE